MQEGERETRALQGEGQRHTTDVLLEIIDDLCMSHKCMERNLFSFAGSVASAVEGKHPMTGGHAQRVASYAVLLAREIGICAHEQKKLHRASMLHDIGKICIFDSIFDKPGVLTDREYRIMKTHTLHGACILKKVDCFEEIVPPVIYHHERVDGKGYPEGLRGEEIPLHARILHVADSFDAMTTYRSYRTSHGKEYAFAEFEKHKGSQFDKDVIEAAFRVL